MRIALLFFLLCSSAVAQSVHNRTAGTHFNDFVSCFAAIADGQSNVLIEVDGPVTATAIATLNKNVTGITIRGISDRQPVLNCGGFDSFMSFNGTGKTLTNITIENLKFIKNNTVTSNAAAIRFTTVGGTNFLRRLVIDSCSVPIRATTNCGAFTVEDCIVKNYTFGTFRFGLGSQTGTLPNVQDMGPMVFRRCKFYGDLNGSTEADLVLKRMANLLVEDCQFYNTAKFGVDVYDPVAGATITIRRNLFQNGHTKATSGGTISIAPNVTTGAGTAENVVIESNIFDGDKGTSISLTTVQNYKQYNNLFLEGVGNTGNTISLVTCKNFLEHYGNIYVCNTTNNNPMVNVGTCTYDTDKLTSDYNIFYKTTARGLFSGTTTGGTQPQALSASTLALTQAKGLDPHSLNTLPIFNTTDRKKSKYYLTPVSPGRLAGNPAYPPNSAIGKLSGTVYDAGPLDLKSYRYRTGRGRIVK